MLGDLGSPSGDIDVGIESLVFARLETKPITGVGKSWNVVRASERSPSLIEGPKDQALQHMPVFHGTLKRHIPCS